MDGNLLKKQFQAKVVTLTISPVTYNLT